MITIFEGLTITYTIELTNRNRITKDVVIMSHDIGEENFKLQWCRLRRV